MSFLAWNEVEQSFQNGDPKAKLYSKDYSEPDFAHYSRLPRRE